MGNLMVGTLCQQGIKALPKPPEELVLPDLLHPTAAIQGKGDKWA